MLFNLNIDSIINVSDEKTCFGCDTNDSVMSELLFADDAGLTGKDVAEFANFV